MSAQPHDNHYGRLNFKGNADSQDREPSLEAEKRHAFRRANGVITLRALTEKAQPATGHTCPRCHLFRTAREFQGFNEVHETCKVCRDKQR